MRTVDAVDQFLSNRSVSCKPKTLIWYKWILNDFAKAYPELPSTSEPIELFLKSPSGDETGAGRFRTLRTFYNFICPHCGTRHIRRRKASASVEVCAHCGKRNPMESVGAPRRDNKLMRVFTPHQLHQIFSLTLSLRDRTLLTLFLDSGIREEEATSLVWDKVFRNFIIVCGKSGEREVPLLAETYNFLMQLKAKDGSDGAVFKGLKGPLTVSGIYQIVHKACSAAGITGKRSSPHTFRHTAATLMISAGCDLETVREILGHSSVAVTQKYLHQNISPVIEKHQRFSPLKAVHAAAQRTLFSADNAVREAEEILSGFAPEVFKNVQECPGTSTGDEEARHVE